MENERIAIGSSPPHGATEALCFLSIKRAVLTSGSSESVCTLQWLKVMDCLNREGFCVSVFSDPTVSHYLFHRWYHIACACIWPAGHQLRLLSPWRGLLPVIGRLGFLCWGRCHSWCVYCRFLKVDTLDTEPSRSVSPYFHVQWK